jgi:small-conductance mechanosensitive channel
MQLVLRAYPMKSLIIALFLLLWFNMQPGFAHQDSSKNKTTPFSTSRQISQGIKIQQLTSEWMADSLKRADLESQIAELKSTDDLKRKVLVNELFVLKQKDQLLHIWQKKLIDSLRHFTKRFAVIPFGKPLFYIFARQGSFTPQDRAEAIGKRLLKLNEDYTFKPDSVMLVSSEQTMDIVYKGNIIASVSDQDALWQNTTKEKLAAQWQQIIADAVVKYQHETSWGVLIKEGLLALAVILLVIALIFGITRLFKWILSRTVAQPMWYNKDVKIKNYTLLNASQGLKALHAIIKVFKWLIIILVIYLALPVLFGIFPFTGQISDTLLGYITAPLKNIILSVWDYIPNLITIIILVVIFRYVLKFFKYIKTEVEGGNLEIPGFYADWAGPTYQILRVLILAFMLIVLFPYLPGSNSPIFKGVSVFLGVLFTFGSAGALGNLVAGLVLTYMRAFKLGDRVKINDITGDIIGRSILVTRLRTPKNEIISIPNSTVISSHTVNYSSDATDHGLILHTTVSIGYDAPWRQVHQLLIDAALNTAMIEQEPIPFVLQTSLDDYYVSYSLNAYTKEPNRQAHIYSQLHQNIQDEFNKAGVEIMSPHYKALRDGNATTIPPDYLSKDYEAPPFNTLQKKE